ncbi:MMPL family transporter [Psychromonas sp.]|uniref:MMPL family transporter n=1 Tax=Psychromonas sp. TaxID=1884585 RepID=UPI0035617818
MNSTISSSKIALLWLVIICGAIFMLLLQTVLQTDSQQKFPIETNILALLPENNQDKFAQQAFQQVTDNLGNKVVFLISSENIKTAIKGADYFTEQLINTDLFSTVSGKLSEQEQQAWANLYFPYRAQLLTETQKKRLAADPAKQSQQVVQQIYNPFSGVTGGELSNDPFLLFREYISKTSHASANISLQQGYLTAEQANRFYIVVYADLADSPYNLNLQDKLPQLTAIESATKDKFHVLLHHTGTLFYASYGTQSAKGEISTIGIGSLVGIILLLLFVYRSALPLFLALLSISCGLLVAFVTTVLVFKKVHLFSLVFGASLIGVSIDYAFHYLTERLVHKDNWDSSLALKHIFNAITLGLVTSLIGYLGLLVAPFPGLQQLSLFSVVGLLSAYLTVVCWYPLLAKSKSQSKPPNLRILQQWLFLWHKPKVRLFVPLFTLFISLLAFSQVTFDDDIRQLQAMPESLKTQESFIKEITGAGQNQQMLLVKADSEQSLLARLKQVELQLKQWKKQGKLVSYQSISQYLPSITEQKENYQLVNQLYEAQAPRLVETLNLARPLRSPPAFSPLTVADFLQSPATKNISYLWLGEIQNSQAAIILINGFKEIELLVKYSESSPDLSYLNKADEISSIFKEYREHISGLLVIAYLLIAALLTWRYKVKQALLVLTPPLIAACAGLAITSLMGIPITIFNLLALILILGIGIDYTLFFAEQKNHKHVLNTLLAITLSAITTVLSFGLLALSETQAIHGFGITVFSGIIVAWLLAPLAIREAS